jgi:hypothetical protein
MLFTENSLRSEMDPELRASRLLRQRNFALLGSGAMLGLAMLAFVPAPSQSADVVTCKALRIVDEGGKVRIIAAVTPSGQASIALLDKQGKSRVSCSTFEDGNAAVKLSDANGQLRVTLGTRARGDGVIEWLDQSGKIRLAAGTTASGEAGVFWLDPAESQRLSAFTKKDSSVELSWLAESSASYTARKPQSVPASGTGSSR